MRQSAPSKQEQGWRNRSFFPFCSIRSPLTASCSALSFDCNSTSPNKTPLQQRAHSGQSCATARFPLSRSVECTSSGLDAFDFNEPSVTLVESIATIDQRRYLRPTTTL